MRIKGRATMLLLQQLLPLLFLLPVQTKCKAILGIDLGSLYMKVALVQRSAPLEIVTNLHSKRKTEQMILFDGEARFYGADASSLLGRKPHLTPTFMSLMLGRNDAHPSVKVLTERHYPLTPKYNETRSGVCLPVDGYSFTPEELVAMVLTHAKDITAAYGVSGGGSSSSADLIRDCVLTVPSFYTQHERRALLDAASLADLNVLALIDENTAAALHFGMDRVDTEKKNVLFYNMGASSVQVSIATFFSYEHKESKFGKPKTVGAFEIKGKGWDYTMGGDAFDARLLDHMAQEFNDKWNAERGGAEPKDVRTNYKAMTKLRIQANKAKHILSANTDIPVFVDGLMEDRPYQSHISRAKFEEITHDLLKKAVEPINTALKAANMTMEDIDMVELIGGGMRVPAVQDAIQKVLGERLDLGMHINSDESMALGAAFRGANVSTAFRVRHVGMTDVNPFAISISLKDLPKEEEERSGGVLSSLFGKGKKDEGDAEKTQDKEKKDEEPWSKHATLFKAFQKFGVKKTIAFTHDQDIHCAIDYEDSDYLPPGTEHAILRYNITGLAKFSREMAEKGLAKPKVSLQFELTESGLTQLIKAEAAVEETVIVDEQIEVEDNETDATEDANLETDVSDTPATEIDAGKAAEGEEEKNSAKSETQDSSSAESDASNETGDDKVSETADEKTEEAKNETDSIKQNKRKTKIITVQKEKKKIRKRALDIQAYFVGRIKPYDETLREESKAKLQALADKDKARMLLEEAKNKLEAYIYHVRNKLVDDDGLVKISTEEQRENLRKMAEEAEDWLYDDGYNADLPAYEAKYAELAEPAEAMFLRRGEMTARPEAVAALRAKLTKVEELMKKWETTMTHITEDERQDVMTKVDDVRSWLDEMEEAQKNTDPWDTPAFTSAEVPTKTKSLESLVGKLSK